MKVCGPLFKQRIAFYSFTAIMGATMISLKVATRKGGKAESLRKTGAVPAVMYGPKEPSTPIALQGKEFEKVFKAAGESTVITLQGVGEDKEALITDVDFHPVTGTPRHVDFYVIEKGKKVTVKVPFEFTGTSAAVKDLGGILVKVMHELEIEVFPKDLPHSIPVDISKLNTFEDKILVKDLSLPSSAEVAIPLDEVIVMVTEAKEEVEEVPAIDITQIETSVERGKKDLPAQAGEEGEAVEAKEAKAKEAKPKEAKPEKKEKKKE